MNGLYTVTLTIPSLPGDTHADAARTFVLVMRDWLAGALDTLTLDVTDERDDGPTRVVYLRAEGVVR